MLVLKSIFLILFIFSNLFSQNYDYREADKLFGDEKWTEAADVYLVLAEQNPYQGYFWDNYAYCLYMQKDYSKAIEIDPEFGNAYLYRGILQFIMKGGDRKKGCEDLKKARDLDVEEAEEFIRLACR